RIQKAGGAFNEEKLRWMNKEHMDRLEAGEYLKYVNEFLPEEVKSLPQYSEDRLERLIPTIRERAETFGDVRRSALEGEYDFAFKAPEVPREMLKFKKDPEVSAALPRLRRVIELLSEADFTSPDSIKESVWQFAEEEGRGEVLWPMRVALTGL